MYSTQTGESRQTLLLIDQSPEIFPVCILVRYLNHILEFASTALHRSQKLGIMILNQNSEKLEEMFITKVTTDSLYTVFETCVKCHSIIYKESFPRKKCPIILIIIFYCIVL